MNSGVRGKHKHPQAAAVWRGAVPLSGPVGRLRLVAREQCRRCAEPYVERFQLMGLDLDEVRAACGGAMEWPEIALRFTLSIPGVHTAIVGTTRQESALANVGASARGALPEEAVTMLRAAFQSVDPGTWDGLT